MTDKQRAANEKRGLVRRGQDFSPDGLTGSGAVAYHVTSSGSEQSNTKRQPEFQTAEVGDLTGPNSASWDVWKGKMATHLLELSSRLLLDTVDKVNENLTSVVLAASLVTLILGYASKQRLSQSDDKEAVRELRGENKTNLDCAGR